MDNTKKAEFEQKNKKQTKLIIIIVACVVFFAIAAFCLFGGIAYFALKDSGENIFAINGNEQIIAKADNGEFQIGQNSVNQNPEGSNNTLGFSAPPQQQQNQSGMIAADGMKTVQAIDKQVGIPMMSVDIPQGWTHELNTSWNQNSDPKISTHFVAKDPNGYGTYFINPIMIFYDAPLLNGKEFAFHPVLGPKEALEYIMNYRKQKEPKVAALNYKITKVTENPNEQNIRSAFIEAEYIEDGIKKHEVIALGVRVQPAPEMTMWTVILNGCADRLEVPSETLKQRLIAINGSQKINQQWVAKASDATAKWDAQNTQTARAYNARSMEQFSRNSASIQKTGDYIRSSNQQSFENRMKSMENVTTMSIDAIKGNETYNSPSGSFKDDTTYKNIWVNPNSPNEKIYTNDSLYNPNSDNNVNSQPWDNAERQ